MEVGKTSTNDVTGFIIFLFLYYSFANHVTFAITIFIVPKTRNLLLTLQYK